MKVSPAQLSHLYLPSFQAQQCRRTQPLSLHGWQPGSEKCRTPPVQEGDTHGGADRVRGRHTQTESEGDTHGGADRVGGRHTRRGRGSEVGNFLSHLCSYTRHAPLCAYVCRKCFYPSTHLRSYTPSARVETIPTHMSIHPLCIYACRKGFYPCMFLHTCPCTALLKNWLKTSFTWQLYSYLMF